LCLDVGCLLLHMRQHVRADAAVCQSYHCNAISPFPLHEDSPAATGGTRTFALVKGQNHSIRVSGHRFDTQNIESAGMHHRRPC